MITGDPMIRTKSVDKNSVAAHTTTFRCWDKNFGGPGASYEPGAGLDTIDLPKTKCNGGIRSNIYFPSFVLMPSSLLTLLLLFDVAAGTERTWTLPTIL